MLPRQIRRLFVSTILLLLGIAAVGSAAEKNFDASALLRAGEYQVLDTHYSGIQHEFAAGMISGDDLRDAFRAFYPTDADLAAKYDAWVKAYPDSYVARLARGIYFKKVGLEARGEKYMSETSQTQIAKMDDAMRKAARDFGASIALDSKPFLSYFHTMDIGRQYVSVEDSRRLFDQAAKLDLNSFGLRTKYMLALEPRWGGTTQAMRDFLEECKKTKLSVANLHELESMVYQEEGNEYRIGGNLPAAEAAYRKALALGPCSCGNVNNDLNNLLFETHQYAAAIPLLDEYLKQKPGDLWALANRGSANMNANRPREAIEDWRQAAEAGDSFSQCHLGMAYLTGSLDLKPNYQKSAYWLRKAAEQGEADAQANLPIAEQLAAGESAIQK